MNDELLIEKLEELLIPKIKEHPHRGRPYSISNDNLIEATYYVLKYGLSWKLVAKMILGNESYKATLNRRYNQLIKDDIIGESFKETVNKYLNENEIGKLIIDSMDTINGNCSKEYTGRSHKLHKQAVRTSIICTENRIPLTYHTDPAVNHDSKLGFNLASKFHINDGKVHYLIGDKGYQMNQENRQILLKDNKLRLVVPKRKYRPRKKKNKTKNKRKKKKVRHSKQMKEALKLRIRVEHTNSILHRSFKRLNTVYDRSMNTFNGFIELAIICMIIHNTTKKIV